jgi:outer membrane lipoprotein-sorting protein
MKKAMDQMRGKTLQAEMIIRTIRPTWSREMAVHTWMKGENYSVIQILSPAKDRGVAFLKRKKEVWNWIPTLERSIKLPPSMMSQSWMGTDFTNDDLVKESSTVEDYTHIFLRDSIIQGNQCYGIELIPKPEAAIVWGKIVVYIDKKNFIELYTKFYDEEDNLVNTMTAYEVKMMGGRLVPTRVEMVPTDKKNQKTEIIYKSIVFDKPIDDNFFTLAQLRSLK